MNCQVGADVLLKGTCEVGTGHDGRLLRGVSYGLTVNFSETLSVNVGL